MHLPPHLLGDALQRYGFRNINFGHDSVAWSIRHQLRDQGLFTADQHIAANQVFELTDVARPVIVLHQADGTL